MTKTTVTSACALLMIGPPSLGDRNDAFCVVPLPDGRGWSIEMHVAGVADILPAGSVADEQAFVRGATRYLPDRTIPMLGEAAERAARLSVDAQRTSLQITVTVTPDGRLIGGAVGRGQIPAGRCTPFDPRDAPDILSDPMHPMHAPLTAASSASDALRAARRGRGAAVYYDLIRGWAADENGVIARISAPLRTVAYVIVQELRIAANEVVARWCVEQGLPILYRNHRRNPLADNADRLMNEITAAAGEPDVFAELCGRLLASAQAATYDPTAHGHHGLRLGAYTHATTPLRRVADLINQRIIFAHLDHAPDPYSFDQLTSIGADCNRRERETTSCPGEHTARRTAQDVALNLDDLDSRQFRRVLQYETGRSIRDQVAVEVARRLESDTLTVPEIAVLIDIGDPSWEPVQLTVVDALTRAHPEMGPSVASVWQQTHPDQPPIAVEYRRRGAYYNQIFAARATHRGIRGKWKISVSKKCAKQLAAWSAIRAYLTGADCPDPEPDWSSGVDVA